MAYLYQEPLLFPHLSVFDNLAFGLRLQSADAHTIRQRTEQMLEALEITEHRDKFPHQLSGGQQQRVNFGRALLIAPRVMLLDEPFSSLDTHTRQRMQELYRQLAEAHRLTTLFVTHDLKEALQMGDELATLREGRWHHYPSREAFLADTATGAQDEIDFWQSMRHS
jgi:putrescine transport system ATP-binding protein